MSFKAFGATEGFSELMLLLHQLTAIWKEKPVCVFLIAYSEMYVYLLTDENEPGVWPSEFLGASVFNSVPPDKRNLSEL